MKVKRILSFALSVILLSASVAVLSVGASAASVWDGSYDALTYDESYAYAGGKGTASEPYLIETAEQLAQLAANCNKWESSDTAKWGYSFNKHFKLIADIDLGDNTWPCIGNKSNGNYCFKGNFDGDGHTVKNLKIDGDKTAGGYGFFGAVIGQQGDSELGIIKNLKLEGGCVNITVTGLSYVGALVGYAKNNLNIQGCESNVSVTVNSAVTSACKHGIGGLVGCFEEKGDLNFEKCIIKSDITVVGAVNGSTKGNSIARVGGIIGNVYGATSGNTLELKMDSCVSVCHIMIDSVNYAGGVEYDSTVGMLIGYIGKNSGDITAVIENGVTVGDIKAVNVNDSWRTGIIGYLNNVPLNRTEENGSYVWKDMGNKYAYSRYRQKSGETTFTKLSNAVIGASSGTDCVSGASGFSVLLSAKGVQTKNVDDDGFCVRFVSELTTREYQALDLVEVGAEVTVECGDTSGTVKLPSNYLYASLCQKDAEDITPQSGYLMAVGIKGLPQGEGDTVKLSYKPYIKLSDGSVFYGSELSGFTFIQGVQA